MRVLDYKNIKLNELSQKYEELDETYLSCASFNAQKEVLIEHYADASFGRDELIIRKLSLEEKTKPKLRILGNFYINLFLSFFASAFGVFLGCIFTIGPANVPIEYGIYYVVFLVICFLAIKFFLFRDKKSYYSEDVPLQEIFIFEFWMIQLALADGNEEINFDDLIQLTNKKLKSLVD